MMPTADELLRELDPQIRSAARHFANGDHALADELAQAGRIGVWRALEEWREGGATLESFLLTRGRSRMQDELKSQRRATAHQQGDADPDLVVPTGRGADEMLDGLREVVRLVAERKSQELRLAVLTGRDRRIGEAILAGKGPTEIGREIGVGYTRARQLVARVRARLDGVDPVPPPAPQRRHNHQSRQSAAGDSACA